MRALLVGQTKIALITCLKKLNVSGAFLILSLEERETPQYNSNLYWRYTTYLYRNTPPINTFFAYTSGWGFRTVPDYWCSVFSGPFASSTMAWSFLGLARGATSPPVKWHRLVILCFLRPWPHSSCSRPKPQKAATPSQEHRCLGARDSNHDPLANRIASESNRAIFIS